MPSIQVRAAALNRLVKDIAAQTSRDVFETLLIKSSTHEEHEDDEINFHLRIMAAFNEVPACFPTNDTNILAKLILRVVRFYETDTKFAGKMNIFTGIMAAGSIGMGDRLFAEKTARALEKNRLNNDFYDLSKEIVGQEEVNAAVKFIQVPDHGFHPDSEFVVFSLV
jgi:hypothetical protein